METRRRGGLHRGLRLRRLLTETGRSRRRLRHRHDTLLRGEKGGNGLDVGRAARQCVPLRVLICNGACRSKACLDADRLRW